MPSYHLKPQGFQAVRRKLILRFSLLVPLLVGVVLFTLWFQSKGEADLLNLCLYIIPIAMALTGFTLWRSLMKSRNVWETYELSLFGATMTRSQGNVPTATYDLQNDLISINENSEGILMLRFNNPDILLVIPKAIENRDDLVKRLREFSEIGTTDEYGKMVRFSWLLQLLVLAALAAFYLYDGKWIVGISGTVLMAYLLYTFVMSQRSTVISTSQKRNTYALLIFLIPLAYRLWSVLD
jgi:hypothetical protein